jgi:hypothetical protein
MLPDSLLGQLRGWHARSLRPLLGARMLGVARLAGR